MEMCVNHPDVEAEATCSVCGRPFCHECLVPGSNPPICTTCAINRAGTEVATAPTPVTQRAPKTHFRRGFLWVAGILSLLIIGELVWMFLQRPAPTRVPQTPEMEQALAMDNLILVQAALADAFETQGRYPNLEEIQNAVPHDVAQKIQNGEITMQRTSEGFLLRIQPPGGGAPLMTMNQDGDLVAPEEAPSP